MKPISSFIALFIVRHFVSINLGFIGGVYVDLALQIKKFGVVYFTEIAFEGYISHRALLDPRFQCCGCEVTFSTLQVFSSHALFQTQTALFL